MFGKNVPENKKNDLKNNLENIRENYRILTGEIVIDHLRIDDVATILNYGWEKNDIQRMIDQHDWNGIAELAAWIDECGESAHGMFVEDDPYSYPLDEDGNYVDGAFGECY